MDTVKHFDMPSLLIIGITLTLFVVALFTKGFSHELLLEAGVFLVSVKLILMGYKSSIAGAAMQQKLDDIRVRESRKRPSRSLFRQRQLTAVLPTHSVTSVKGSIGRPPDADGSRVECLFRVDCGNSGSVCQIRRRHFSLLRADALTAARSP